jgi:hypothetical protein
MIALPDPCGVAFKEWHGICQALLEGRQMIVVRKGGISEGPGGFAPEHRAFWLYPTQVHQAQQGLRDEEQSELPAGPEPDSGVSMQGFALVELIHRLESEEDLPALAPFHVWTPETIRSRFRYRQPGLWVLAVRVFRRDPPWTLVPTVEQRGCKSWVLLEPFLSTRGLEPVLAEEAWNQRYRHLQSAISKRSPVSVPWGTGF